MSLVMEEFYRNLRSVGVSAVTGEGCEAFEKALEDARQEFRTSYVPFLLEQRRDMEEKRQRVIEEQMRSFERDLDRAKRARDPADGEMGDLEADLRGCSVQER